MKSFILICSEYRQFKKSYANCCILYSRMGEYRVSVWSKNFIIRKYFYELITDKKI